MLEVIDYLVSHPLTKLVVIFLAFCGGMATYLRFFHKRKDIDELRARVAPLLRFSISCDGCLLHADS